MSSFRLSQVCLWHGTNFGAVCVVREWLLPCHMCLYVHWEGCLVFEGLPIWPGHLGLKRFSVFCLGTSDSMAAGVVALPATWGACMDAAEVAAGTGPPNGETKATVSAYLKDVQNLVTPMAAVGVFYEDFDQKHDDFPVAVYDKGVMSRALLYVQDVSRRAAHEAKMAQLREAKLLAEETEEAQRKASAAKVSQVPAGQAAPSQGVSQFPPLPQQQGAAQHAANHDAYMSLMGHDVSALAVANAMASAGTVDVGAMLVTAGVPVMGYHLQVETSVWQLIYTAAEHARNQVPRRNGYTYIEFTDKTRG